MKILIMEVSVMKKTATENEIIVSGTRHYQADAFVKIEASKLSLEDTFMKYKPKDRKEKKLMQMIKDEIIKGPKDFWRPKYDPSFNKAGTGICYEPGKRPALGRSYIWWYAAAQEFMPKCKSRLGTKYEYIIFLAVLIKELVKRGWPVEKAWRAVCVDSTELGHYCNSENYKFAPEHTASRELCGFFDLANTAKVLVDVDDDDSFYYFLVGGGYGSYGGIDPLASIVHKNTKGVKLNYSVGWLVFEEDPNK